MGNNKNWSACFCSQTFDTGPQPFFGTFFRHPVPRLASPVKQNRLTTSSRYRVRRRFPITSNFLRFRRKPMNQNNRETIRFTRHVALSNRSSTSGNRPHCTTANTRDQRNTNRYYQPPAIHFIQSSNLVVSTSNHLPSTRWSTSKYATPPTSTFTDTSPSPITFIEPTSGTTVAPGGNAPTAISAALGRNCSDNTPATTSASPLLNDLAIDKTVFSDGADSAAAPPTDPRPNANQTPKLTPNNTTTTHPATNHFFQPPPRAGLTPPPTVPSVANTSPSATRSPINTSPNTHTKTRHEPDHHCYPKQTTRSTTCCRYLSTQAQIDKKSMETHRIS